MRSWPLRVLLEADEMGKVGLLRTTVDSCQGDVPVRLVGESPPL